MYSKTMLIKLVRYTLSGIFLLAFSMVCFSSYKTYHIFTNNQEVIAPLAYLTPSLQGVSPSSSGEEEATSQAEPSEPEEPIDPRTPVKLTIPSLKIKAPVVKVGITKTGAMAVPYGFKNVGWYKYGTYPGEIGSAVIAGHIDNALALDGVFKHLDQLEIGDTVIVETEGGTTYTYRVIEMGIYPYDQAPNEEIFGRGNAAQLNLVTCAGTWSKELKTYDKRLVIYTELIKE